MTKRHAPRLSSPPEGPLGGRTRRRRWLILGASILGIGGIVWGACALWRGDRRGPVPPAPPLDPAVEARGLRQEAMALVEQLSRDFPDSVGVLHVQGRLLERWGNRADAIRCWERCIALDPGFGPPYESRGLDAAQRGDFALAEPMLRKAMELNPELVRAGLRLAELLESQGRTDESIAVLEQYLVNHPDSADAHVRLGRAQFSREAYDRAAECYQNAIRLDPVHVEAHQALATLYRRLGDREKARQSSEKLKGLRDAIQDAKKRAILDARTETGRYSDEPAMRRSLADDYVQIGQVYRADGKHRQAESCWRKAAAIDPDCAEARAALAQAFVQTGRNVSEAPDLAREAVRLAPTAENYFVLGMACAGNGDRAGAVRAIAHAAQLDPDNPRYRDAQRQLRQKPQAGAFP